MDIAQISGTGNMKSYRWCDHAPDSYCRAVPSVEHLYRRLLRGAMLLAAKAAREILIIRGDSKIVSFASFHNSVRYDASRRLSA